MHYGRPEFVLGLGHEIDIWEAEGLFRSHIQGGLLYILNLDLADNRTASDAGRSTASALAPQSATTGNVLAGPSSSPTADAPTSISHKIAASWYIVHPSLLHPKLNG